MGVGDPGWLGLFLTDQYVRLCYNKYEVELGTTNAIDALVFPYVLRVVGGVGVSVKRDGRGVLGVKYLVHLVDWPWPLDKGVATGLISGFDLDGLLRFVAWLCLVMVVFTTPIGLR